MRIALLLGTCVALLTNNTMAAITTLDVDTVDFWKTHSIVFGEVTSVERLGRGQHSKGTHRVSLRPEATLAGRFDPGLHRELALNVWVGPRTSSIRDPPRPKQKVILVVWNKGGSLIVPAAFAPFMPNAAALAPVSGFADPEVEKTLSAIQRIRAMKAPFIIWGGADFWKNHSVVFGEVLSVKRLGGEQFFQGTHRITLRPEATLAGPFDPELHRKIALNILAGTRISRINEPPRPKQKVICVLWNDNGVFRVPSSSIVSFMPGNHPPLLPVSGFSDPNVEKTLSKIQAVRRPRQTPKHAPQQGKPPSP
jgi:hypothetical protein